MSRKEYFAYGSNLNFEQMAYRCPEATVVGTAKLDGYELAFRRGYLTILPKEGASVEGLIWSVTDHDEWQSYRNKANFPKMVAAACIINDGSSDDRFTDFRNWLIMQGYDAYRQALIDPDNLAALNIPFRDTEWMGCGNVAWYAYAGQQLHTYFEKEEIAAKLFRKYPALLKSSADLHQAIMQEQLAPHRAQETEWERQMLRTEVKHYIEVSGLAYSYNKFYAQNAPDKVAWETLQSDLFSNLPQIKAERMPQDFSVVLPKLWRKRQAWDAERTKRPPYRGEER